MKLAGALVLVIFLSALGIGAWIAAPLPSGMLATSSVPGLVLEDRSGLPLRSTRASDGSLRRWVAIDEIDPDVIAAFIAVEDRRFYRHGGIDLRAIARAALVDLRARHIVSGASTISMQLARILRASPRSWSGKLSQALWALRIERHLPKQTILEQYLNRVPLGQGAVGVEAAASLYFSSTATDLSLGQAALLAGLARAPSRDTPLVSAGRALQRRRAALERLVVSSYVTRATAERAASEPLLARSRTHLFLAPHFTTRVVDWIERDTVQAQGTWRTSLDLPLQVELETEVRHTVESLTDRGASQAAAVVLDNDTGEILAWIGSPDFWADTAGQVDMVTSPRQPGSALKPFLYALAFDRGYTPASILADIAHVYQTSTGPYAPRNYDRRFHGPVRAREALASSYNLPAVALADAVGVGSLLHLLREAGFTSLGRSAEYYGLGLSLGNGDLTLLELANGYRALAQGGVWRPYRWRASVPGDPVEQGRRIVSSLAAAVTLDILSDPVARIPGFGLETPLDFPFPVAAKTGTSRHFTDNWAVGAAGRFTVAVWVGNFSGRPMDGVSGVSGAGPLLHRAMLAVARRYAPGVLPTPASAGAVPVTICRLSGLRAGPHCPGMVEWFDPATAPTRPCDWHRGNAVVFPPVYAEWDQERTERTEMTERGEESSPPSPSFPSFRILSPLDGDVYRIPPGVDRRYSTVALRAAAGAGSSVRWFVDGREQRSTRWPLAPGVHKVEARSSRGELSEVTVRVE
jgi:penicillin-binding protein 1C